jgi:hypothetical protein
MKNKGVTMQLEKGGYFKDLSEGKLFSTTLDRIQNHIKNQGLSINQIPPSLLKKNKYGEKITEQLTRLSLSVIEGNPSWEGLFVGFPGNKEQLSTKSVGTPYLRMILYPILDLHHRLRSESGKKLPCIYFVGERFSDVFLRKFELIKDIVPKIIVLTHDIYECAKNKSLPPMTDKNQNNESWTQMKLGQMMYSPGGLTIPTPSRGFNVKFISSEIPCSEGTENPERLDLLGYDVSDHALIALEIKGVNAGRVELENLFLQGLEHRNWIEKNKMAVKLLFDRGPRGKRINTRKRVRLLLGFYGNTVPHIFYELHDEAKRRDKYIEIDFVRISNENDTIIVDSFD